MDIEFPYRIALSFPGDLEYIPAVRKFISEVLQVSNFSSKFAYRSEIIVDEISNNAVNYGCHDENASVDLECLVHEDRIEFEIRDQGGSKENIDRLHSAVRAEPEDNTSGKGLGIEIVRMLSESMDINIDDQNLTSVHIIRKREES